LEGKKYYGQLLKYVSITLVEAGKAILMVFAKDLQNEGLKQLTARSTSLIEEGYITAESTKVLLNIGVKEIDEKVIHLSNGDKLPYGFCVWAAGNGPNPLVLDKVPVQKAGQSIARGRLVIDDWLRMKGASQVYGIGDCTFIENAALPATAQVASQQGSYLGRLFSKGYILTDGAAPIKRRSVEDTAGSSVAIDNSSKAPDNGPIWDLARKSLVEEERPQRRRRPISPTDNINYISEKTNIGNIGISSKGVDYAKPFQFLNLGVLAYIGRLRLGRNC
jgi:NADH dehydrogenase FAD-containing subunit